MSKRAAQLEALADAVADCIGKVIAGPKVGGRFDALEHRLQALEGKPHVKSSTSGGPAGRIRRSTP